MSDRRVKPTTRVRPPTPALNVVLRDPQLLLAFGLGSGLSPMAPGTVGSLFALLLLWPLLQLPLLLYLLVLALGFALGCQVCAHASRRLQVADHSGIVIDEFIGLWLSALPLYAVEASPWLEYALVFGLFRFFDILKPWPIRWFDRHVKGGFGVMLDDAVAALPAAAGVWLTLIWF